MIDADRLTELFGKDAVLREHSAELFAQDSVLREHSAKLHLRGRELRDISSECRVCLRVRLNEALRARSQVQAEHAIRSL